MDFDPVYLAVVVFAGLGAGFINTFAGGGSMLTLPALMLLGLPADVANGTNRLCVVTQTAAGLWSFQREGRLEHRALPSVVIPTLVGATLGAYVAAAWLPRDWVKPVLLGTMLLMAVAMLVSPKLLAPDAGQEQTPRQRPWAILGLFFAGLYGGFVQAGVGFVLLAVLGGTLRYDLVRANALKLAVIMVFGVVALGIFVMAGQVEWVAASVLAVATVVGARLGVRFAIEVKPKTLRIVVFVLVVIATVAAAFR